MRFSTQVLPALLVSLVAAGGCDWVDSTGKQSNESSVRVLLDDVPPGGALALNEDMIASIDPRPVGFSGEASYTWKAASDAEGALDTCRSIEGFRSELAAASLTEACTEADDCSLEFEQIEGETPDSVSFSLRVPQLKAPVGIRRTLETTSLDGPLIANAYDLCLIAINEAPDAVDDGPYELVEGTTLTIGDDEPTILANDTDDIDVGNLPQLTIRTETVVQPSFATSFEILPGGGFSYGYANIDLLEPLTDRFEYEVDDGVHTGAESARASVEIRIVPGNRGPVLIAEIAPIEARAGELLSVDLGASFSDPEGAALEFTADEARLPESRSLSVGRDGVLSGTPLPEDVGRYQFTLTASDDGDRDLAQIIDIEILPPLNQPPEYEPESVDDVLVPVGVRIAGISGVFSDPDGDLLTYVLLGEVPRGLAIDDETGVITGRPRVRGIFRGVIIRASDPQGEFVESEPFTIRVF